MPDALVELLRNLLSRLTKPGPLYVFVEGQTMSVMRLKVLLPPLSGADDDVTKRELSVKVGDAEATKTEFGPGVAEHTFTAARGAAVRLQLVDIDGSGNRSEASSRDFTVLDTIPPARPGEMAVNVEGQEPDAPA